MSIKLLDKLRLQICSLLCVSLAEVQGNRLIFMEIKDNIHQLSFTSFIFISFLILTLSTRRPLSARFGEVFWTAETGGSLRSLLWELYQTHTLNLWGMQTLSDLLSPEQNFQRDSHIFFKKKSEVFAFSAPCYGAPFPHKQLHQLQAEKVGSQIKTPRSAAHNVASVRVLTLMMEMSS